mgnify:CR=1 FL=1
MSDDLRQNLEALGLNESNCKALALFPLIQVAWADGKIQSSERKAIKKIANKIDLLSGGGDEVVDGWLKNRPSPDEVSISLKTLVQLARDSGSNSDEVTPHTLNQLIHFSYSIAQAAGGMFGLSEPITRAELDCLEEIAQSLSIVSADGWLELMALD